MEKEIVLKALSAYCDKKSDAFKCASDFFINGISDGWDTYKIENFDNPYLFVEMVVCVLEDPTTKELSDNDHNVIDQMNYIAQDITDLM